MFFFLVCSFWNPPSRRNTGEQHGRELQQIIVFTFLDNFKRFFQWAARACSVRGKGLAILIWFGRLYIQTISQVLSKDFTVVVYTNGQDKTRNVGLTQLYWTWKYAGRESTGRGVGAQHTHSTGEGGGGAC
jgi:hypothetical protein